MTFGGWNRRAWRVLATLTFATGVFVGTNRGPGAETNFVYPVSDEDACGPQNTRGDRVLAWAKQHGANIHPHVAAAKFESALETRDGRQIVATGPIVNESLLLEIPPQLHMSVKRLRGHAGLGKHIYLRHISAYLSATSSLSASSMSGACAD